MIVDLHGQTVIITGAAGGIGQALALRLAQNGAGVAICDLNRDGAQAAAEQICRHGLTARPYVLDVTDQERVSQVFDDVANDFGKIDILINNAGINVGPDKRFPIHEFDDAQWANILDVDLNGVYYCSKAAIPHMIRNGGGNIINISSVVGLVPFRRQCAFTAAKAGVINLTKAMALELAEYGIRVNAIAPGSILIDKTEQLFYHDPVKTEAMLSHIPQKRPGKPDDIAYAALYLACAEANYVTGSVLTVDGGWTCGYARDF